MVYVDDMYKISLGKFSRMKMSHVIADTSEELLTMIDKIGVQRKWLQNPDTCNEHFDICMSKRKLAVQLGAKEISYRDYAKEIERRCDSIGIHFALASTHKIK